jgi:site-specific DNA-methyltransferase (adenine-specific)
MSPQDFDLRRGDALNSVAGLPSLATDAVDCCITDPPFDARTHRAAIESPRQRDGQRRIGDALSFAPLSAEGLPLLALQIVRVTRRWILIFTAERMIEAWAAALESADARFVRLGIAERSNPRPQMSGDRPAPGADWIVIAHASPGRMRWNGRGRPAVWRAPAARFDAGGQVHPTQKPLGLLRALIEDFSSAGELVCDPFFGSGTTAVACRESGRRFVGWEIDERYHASAAKRVERAREQLSLVAAHAEPAQAHLTLCDEHEAGERAATQEVQADLYEVGRCVTRED